MFSLTLRKCHHYYLPQYGTPFDHLHIVLAAALAGKP
jgi:hypothetical protein